MKRAIGQSYDTCDTQFIIKRYQSSARHYDKFINLYTFLWRTFGFRYDQWRKQAIDELNLIKGQNVVDLGCGTGLNFLHLEKVLGPSGHIYGVDISPKMLGEANKKIDKNGWNNISLIKSDFNKFKFPEKVDAVISTYSIGLSIQYEDVIQNSFQHLKYGGKLVILGFKNQNLSIGAKMFLPFWLSCVKDYSSRSFRKELTNPGDFVSKIFPKNKLIEFYGGLVFLSIGIKEKEVLK